MVSSDGEECIGSSVIASRSVAFHELVIAIIDAGERPSVGVMPLGATPRQSDLLTDLLPLFAIATHVLLVQRELRHITLRRVTLIEGLVDIQLVSEDDDLILRGLASRSVRAIASVVRVVGIVEPSLVRVTRRTNHSIFVQRGCIFDSELATFSNSNGLTLGISKRLDIVDGEGESAISSGSSRIQSQGVLGRRNDSIAILNSKARSFRISQTSRLVISKDQLVGLVRREIILVLRQGGGQLERDFIVHIVIGGILPVALSTSGVVDVLDLLFEGRLVSLTGDGHVFIANNPDNIQRLSIITGHSIIFVLGQVVTGRNLCQRSRCSEIGAILSSQVCELENLSKFLLIRLRAINLSQLFGSFRSSQVLSLIACSIFSLKIGTSLDVAKCTVCAIGTSKNLVDRVGVGISVSDLDTTSWVIRHGGGGTGETGDRHRRSGCHSDEALENLVHCSPFLSCLKS